VQGNESRRSTKELSYNRRDRISSFDSNLGERDQSEVEP
jgi:hypothetical protein